MNYDTIAYNENERIIAKAKDMELKKLNEEYIQEQKDKFLGEVKIVLLDLAKSYMTLKQWGRGTQKERFTEGKKIHEYYVEMKRLKLPRTMQEEIVDVGLEAKSYQELEENVNALIKRRTKTLNKILDGMING